MNTCIFFFTKQLSVFLALLVIFITPGIFYAQAPGIEWQKCLGGNEYDEAYSIVKTSDGGYVIAGSSTSLFVDGKPTGNHGLADVWIAKLDSYGSIQWQKCYGGSKDDYAYSIIQSTDGGYVFTGQTYSTNMDVSGNHGGIYDSLDAWVVKLDSTGNMEWQRCLGGSGDDFGESIIQTFDGGYIVGCSTNSNDGDVSGSHGGNDFWVVKLSNVGKVEWQKCLGGSDYDWEQSLIQTRDSGFAIVGTTASNDELIIGNHGGFDAWVIKLSSSGSIEWQKCIGGTAQDEGNSIIQTFDGGFAVCGFTSSSDGDVSINQGGDDAWVFKLDPLGNLVWQKSLGGSGKDNFNDIIQTADTGIVAVGYSNSSDGDVTGKLGTYTDNDEWVVKLSSSGNLEWQECLGGTKADEARSILESYDGSYIVAGITSSHDDDVVGNHGYSDAWVVKLGNNLSAANSSETKQDFNLSTFPNPASKSTTLAFDLLKSSLVEVEIYNMMGERINNTHQTEYEPGHHEIPIDLEDFTVGTYFIQLRSNGNLQTTPIQIVR